MLTLDEKIFFDNFSIDWLMNKSVSMLSILKTLLILMKSWIRLSHFKKFDVSPLGKSLETLQLMPIIVNQQGWSRNPMTQTMNQITVRQTTMRRVDSTKYVGLQQKPTNQKLSPKTYSYSTDKYIIRWQSHQVKKSHICFLLL